MRIINPNIKTVCIIIFFENYKIVYVNDSKILYLFDYFVYIVKEKNAKDISTELLEIQKNNIKNNALNKQRNYFQR